MNVSLHYVIYQVRKILFYVSNNKRPAGLIAPLLRFWHLLGNPPKNTTKGTDLLFNECIRLLNIAFLVVADQHLLLDATTG